MWMGHPILDEIRKGFKLRPTTTVDKSKPIIYAEGEDSDAVAPTKRASAKAPPVVELREDDQVSFGLTTTECTPGTSDQLNTEQLSEADIAALLSDSEIASILAEPSAVSTPRAPASSPAPPPPAVAPPPPPIAPPPPPSSSSASSDMPPPPPPPQMRRPPPAKLLQLGGSGQVDRGALLRSIQGGVRLRKTVTNDKSGLILDPSENIAITKRAAPGSPNQQCSPPPIKLPSPDRFIPNQGYPVPPPPPVVPSSDSSYSRSSGPVKVNGTPHYQPLVNREPPVPYVPPTQQQRPMPPTVYPAPPPTPPANRAMSSSPLPPKKSDYFFDENNLRVTREDLEQEIPQGTAAARIARFTQPSQQSTQRGYEAPAWRQVGTIKSKFHETNGQLGPAHGTSSTLPRTHHSAERSVRWAPVETGGLRKPSQMNMASERRPEPPRDAIQSDYQHQYQSTSPLTVVTDENGAQQRTTKAQTPPRREMSKSASQGNLRMENGRPAAQPAQQWNGSSSPASTLSSPSLPSPSSLSPGRSASPTQRRRINPAFDKAKQLFNEPEKQQKENNGTIPAPRAFFLRNTLEMNARQKKQQEDQEVRQLKNAVTEAARKKSLFADMTFSPSSDCSSRPGYSSSSASSSSSVHLPSVPLQYLPEFSTRPSALFNPDAFRRNYQFSIDLTQDSPIRLMHR